MISEKLLEKIEHELTSLTGLYVCDNKEFKDCFQLDYSDLLNEIEKEMHSK